jgi:Dolichyl-phosphate-mannose-protein mannosyltransferase
MWSPTRCKIAGMLSRTKQYLHARLTHRDPFDLASMLLLTALVLGALLIFRDYAISNDEEVQHRYGEMILAYYASGLTDTSLFEFRNLYLYGGLFDIVAVLLAHVLPFEPYLIRHVLCALIGIGGIYAAWATARLIAGPRAGLFAAMALAYCGPYFGSMFNHTKDIPFAAAAMGATYFIILTARALPQPRLRDVLCLGLLLGAGIGVRAMGLVILLYVPMAIALRMPWHSTNVTAGRFALRSLAAFTPAFILAYLIMAFSWPWAVQDLLNPVRALFTFAHFHYPIHTLLFGKSYEMGEVPRWYVPAYLAIKLPLTMLFGAALGLIFTLAQPHPSDTQTGRRRREVMFIAFISAFPVLCQVIVNGPAFTGLRHFFFVVPLLAVLAGIGFDDALNWLSTRSRDFATAAFAAICVCYAWNAGMLVRLHPYEYMFYNPLVGGLEGA